MSFIGFLNELRKSKPLILSLFRNEFNKFNNTGARMSGSIYHLTFKLFWNHIFGVKTL